MSLKAFMTLSLGILSLIWPVLGGVCLLNSPNPKLYIIDIFTLPILMACLLWLVMMLVARQIPATVITAVAAICLLGAHWPQMYPPQAKPASDAAPVTVLFHNLWYQNHSATALRAMIDKQQPDLVVLIEVAADAQPELFDGLGKRYPYRDTHYDRLILSRFPLSDVAYAKKLNATHARVKTPDGPMHLIAVHLTRPWPFKRGSQTAQVERLERFMRPYDDKTTLMVGDFNSTPSAALLRGFAKRQSLAPAPAATGTWPNYLPGVLRLGIDNGFCGSGLRFDTRTVLGNTGSDHRPVLFTLRRAEKADQVP